jgi:hypothetical protein
MSDDIIVSILIIIWLIKTKSLFFNKKDSV